MDLLFVSALDYPLDLSSYEGPKGDKASEYNPNGWGAQILFKELSGLVQVNDLIY